LQALRVFGKCRVALLLMVVSCREFQLPGSAWGKLRLAGLAGGLAEEDVVIRIGIERRVEIDEVNAGVGKNLRIAQPLEIVIEQEAVHLFLRRKF